MQKKHTHEEHRKRMKARFLEHGFEHFNDFEILEMILFYSLPRKDTRPIAINLIKKFGSLSAVLEASINELCSVDGISSHSATLIKLIPELARVYVSDNNQGITSFSDYTSAGKYFVSAFVGMQEERIVVAFLDNSMNLIKSKVFDAGDVSSSFISNRNITRMALESGATHVMMAHNHPKGIAIPSAGDLSATRSISAALEIVGVELNEHFVVSGDKYMGILKMRASFDSP
ncbi:MAG: RadC family protein [Clostridia bacterium]|nr:RadC family protein [Clostridia bacterium]